MSAFVPFAPPPARAARRALPMVRVKSSFVVYRGPSALNGAPIVAILSNVRDPSVNGKTGPMAQLWILTADESPTDAQRSGADAAVCGACPMRPALAKPGAVRCYVKPFRGALPTWKANHAEPEDLNGAIVAMAGRALRLGAYGDPAAIPESAGVVQALCAAASTWTGYSHQWRDRRAAWLRPYVMASIDVGSDRTVRAELGRAHRAGWRTFRVTDPDRPTLIEGAEIVCPYVTHGRQCIECGLCTGALAASTRSIVIAAH